MILVVLDRVSFFDSILNLHFEFYNVLVHLTDINLVVVLVLIKVIIFYAFVSFHEFGLKLLKESVVVSVESIDMQVVYLNWHLEADSGLQAVVPTFS